MKKQLFALTLIAAMILGWVLPSQADAALSDIDVSTDEGAAITEMVAAGFIAPLEPGKFCPDEPISAADYIVMICRQRGVRPAATQWTGQDAGYMQAALDAGWYNWDQIPPDRPDSASAPISRELGANIVVAAYFGRDVTYDYNEESRKLPDFEQVGGRYYFGVLGGLSKGIFGHASGTPFRPAANLSRGQACLWVANASRGSQTPPSPSTAPQPSVPPLSAAGGVSANGWLAVRGTQLINERGEAVALRGMSSHGIQWFPQYTSRQSIENTVSRGANIFRVAMYVEQGGYMQNAALMKERVISAVGHALQSDAYVIIDWHILEDGNPQTHEDAAAAFFAEMAERYADIPNVLYEICNEPNGNITWSGNVKPYAEHIVRVIRERSPRGIILIGSPMWDQDVDQAAADPVAGSNLMYTLHFYAGTHHQPLRDKADRALALGAPIFVSEWGTSAADGSGGVFFDSADEWMAWMDRHNLSWCNWSLCDKDESSAALVPGTPADTVWTESNLSASGRYVFARFGSVSAAPVPMRVVTAAAALEQFGVPTGLRGVVTRDSTVLQADSAVSTGCRLQLLNASDAVVEECTIVVMGDVLGNGRITIAQLVAMARALTGQQTLTGAALAAADFDGSSRLDIGDLVREARLLTADTPLTCRFLT